MCPPRSARRARTQASAQASAQAPSGAGVCAAAGARPVLRTAESRTRRGGSRRGLRCEGGKTRGGPRPAERPAELSCDPQAYITQTTMLRRVVRAGPSRTDRRPAPAGCCRPVPPSATARPTTMTGDAALKRRAPSSYSDRARVPAKAFSPRALSFPFSYYPQAISGMDFALLALVFSPSLVRAARSALRFARLRVLALIATGFANTLETFPGVVGRAYRNKSRGLGCRPTSWRAAPSPQSHEDAQPVKGGMRPGILLGVLDDSPARTVRSFEFVWRGQTSGAGHRPGHANAGPLSRGAGASWSTQPGLALQATIVARLAVSKTSSARFRQGPLSQTARYAVRPERQPTRDSQN